MSQIDALRGELGRVPTLRPHDALTRLDELEQDMRQLSEAQVEGMSGDDVAQVWSRLRAMRADVEARLAPSQR